MQRRLLTLPILYMLTAGPALGDDIGAMVSDSAREQFDKIRSLQAGAQFSQAEAATLLLLERARGQDAPLDIAAAFHELGHIAYSQNNYDLAFNAFTKAQEIITREEQLPQLAEVLADIGNTYRAQAQYSRALEYLYRAITLYQSLGNDQGVAKQNLNIGIVLNQLGQYEQALTALQSALVAFRLQANLSSVGQCLFQIGSIYLNMDQRDQAESYLKDSLQISQQLERKEAVAASHSQLGELYLVDGQYALARQHLNNAISIYAELDTPFNHDWALTSLGQVELSSGNFRQGLDYLNEALQRASQGRYGTLVSKIHLALATAFYNRGDYDAALLHADKGLTATQKRAELPRQVDFLALLVNVHRARGEFQLALDALEQQNLIEKEMVDQNSAMSLAQMKSEIEVERQAQSIELLRKNKAISLAKAEQKNLQTTLFLGSLVAILLFAFLLWSRFTQRQRNVLLKREVRARTQELEKKNSQLEEAYRTLEQVSLRDPLTGLYNRHYLEAHLPGEIQRCQHSYASYSTDEQVVDADLLCFLLDIDNFKRINDEYGHLSGDRFLVQFTRIIHEVFRQTDLLIRWGGEEFLVICRHANRQDMPMLAERFRSAISQATFELNDDKQIQASCSIGFCTMPLFKRRPYKVDWQKTFAMMDYCLYAAKLSGKNCWVGLLEADENPDKFYRKHTALEEKFALPQADIATSLNNIASINWPKEN